MLPKLKHDRLFCSSSKSHEVCLINDNENNEKKINTNVNKFTTRTCSCGDLRINNVGETVVLCGWLEYQRMKKFVVLRDSYGETQVMISEKASEIINIFFNFLCHHNFTTSL